MKAIGVIPARYASTRLEGKMLKLMAGKPMIQHVWERASKSTQLDKVIIACDDQRIVEAAEGFGAEVILTSAEHSSGSDRIAEAVESLEADIIVNIQGDEPLIDPDVIDHLVLALDEDYSCEVATVIKEFSEHEDLNDPNVVKVVKDESDYALYFSRSIIPHVRVKGAGVHYKHIGIYAYRKEFLLIYTQLPKSSLEISEQLEQLRILESGYKIKTILTQSDSIGVDTIEDFNRVEAKIMALKNDS